MSLLLYAIGLFVAVSLFKVNPLLCVAVLGGYAFLKLRPRRRRTPPSDARAVPETSAALIAACLALLNQARTVESQPHRPRPDAEAGARLELDPLGGLFRD